jgi:hypothetical protein
LRTDSVIAQQVEQDLAAAHAHVKYIVRDCVTHEGRTQPLYGADV